MFGDVLGAEGDLAGGCAASVPVLAGALEGAHEGFERVLESIGAFVPGAPVAADPPPARAAVLCAGGLPGGGEVLAEEPQVRVVEDADGCGDQGGAGERVQGRGVIDPVIAPMGVAGGCVLAERVREGRGREQRPARRPGRADQPAGQPQVCEVLSGGGGTADAQHGCRPAGP